MLRLALLKTILLITVSWTSYAKTPTIPLTIHFENLSTEQGAILLLVQNANQKDLAKLIVPITDKSSTITLYLSAGKYAISGFHDINGNEKLDTNLVGIPDEPYGFSNDARGTFGKPDFSDQLFSLTEQKTVTFELK